MTLLVPAIDFRPPPPRHHRGHKGRRPDKRGGWQDNFESAEQARAHYEDIDLNDEYSEINNLYETMGKKKKSQQDKKCE